MNVDRAKRRNAKGEMIEILPENVRANRHADQEVGRSVRKGLAMTMTTTIVPTKSKSQECYVRQSICTVCVRTNRQGMTFDSR
jgi:hypothetical protein